MEKDPICGMDVKEEGAPYTLHLKHRTLYFCSSSCKDTYTRQSSMKKTGGKKGIFTRFLEKLAKENEQSYGGTPPKCH